MTKLRSRLLVSLVLAAVAIAIAGIEAASARPSERRSLPAPTSFTSSRPGAGSFGGEPDPTGNGSPQPSVKPASLVGLPNFWLLDYWIKWRMRSHHAQRHARR
ncbi:MAG: hypothetical protein IT347_04815 [Candidatus Eisenbacteria bacterium]|nr:hypothetical protein [Candidatus Eisenbacteria bacterium]